MDHTFSCELDILGASIRTEIAVDGADADGYEIDLQQEQRDAETVVLTASVRRTDGRPFVLTRFHTRAYVPLIDIHGVWTGYGERGLTDHVPWRHEHIVSSNTGFPFVLLMNRTGVNRLSFGLLEQVHEAKMVYSMDELTADYEICFERPIAGPTPPTTEYVERTYLSRKPLQWYDAVSDYVRASDDASCLGPIEVPDAAREPVYCTWYAIHHDVTAEWTERQIEAACELGFRTLIVDDGWFFDGHGAWGGYRLAGDWRPAESKFPDFAAHVKRVQATGAKYLLWVAPFMVGIESAAFKKRHQQLSQHDHGSFRCLCPRNIEAYNHVVKLLEFLMLEFGVDGFKLDFIDAVSPTPCTADHRHAFETQGEAMDGVLYSIRAELEAINKDVMLEFRQSYANPACRRHATMFRAGDAPMDFDSNLWRIVTVRSYAGTVPVHFDPAYWNELETEENVARHMMSSVFCVPMLSVDFGKLPDTHIRIIKRWMDFYHRNKRLINFGRFEPAISNAAIETITMSDGDRAIIGLFRGPLVPAVADEVNAVDVLNVSNSESITPDATYAGWNCECQDRFGGILSQGLVNDAAMGVPIGGVMRLQQVTR